LVGYRIEIGMKVIGHDKMVHSGINKKWNIDLMKMGDIWPITDYIVIHVPLDQCIILINVFS